MSGEGECEEIPTCGSENHGCESHPDTPIEQCDCEDVEEEIEFIGGAEQADRLETVAEAWRDLARRMSGLGTRLETLKTRLSDDEWSAVSRSEFTGNIDVFVSELDDVGHCCIQVAEWLEAIAEALREYERASEERRNELIRLGIEMGASILIGVALPVVGKLLMLWKAKRIKEVVTVIKNLNTGVHTTIVRSTSAVGPVIKIKYTTRAQRFVYAWAQGAGVGAAQHTGSKMLSEQTLNPFEVWDGEDVLTVIVSAGVGNSLKSLRKLNQTSSPGVVRTATNGAVDSVAGGALTTTIVDQLLGRDPSETWETIKEESWRNAIGGTVSSAAGHYTDDWFNRDITTIELETRIEVQPPPAGYEQLDSGLYVQENATSDGTASEMVQPSPPEGHTQRDSGLYVPDSLDAPAAPAEFSSPLTPNGYTPTPGGLYIPDSVVASSSSATSQSAAPPAFDVAAATSVESAQVSDGATSAGHGSTSPLGAPQGDTSRPQYAMPGAAA